MYYYMYFVNKVWFDNYVPLLSAISYVLWLIFSCAFFSQIYEEYFINILRPIIILVGNTATEILRNDHVLLNDTILSKIMLLIPMIYLTSGSLSLVLVSIEWFLLHMEHLINNYCPNPVIKHYLSISWKAIIEALLILMNTNRFTPSKLNKNIIWKS